MICFPEFKSEPLAFSPLNCPEAMGRGRESALAFGLVQAASPPGVPSGCGLRPYPHPVGLCLRYARWEM